MDHFNYDGGVGGYQESCGGDSHWWYPVVFVIGLVLLCLVF